MLKDELFFYEKWVLLQMAVRHGLSQSIPERNEGGEVELFLKWPYLPKETDFRLGVGQQWEQRIFIKKDGVHNHEIIKYRNN